jgi:hypothetical protein
MDYTNDDALLDPLVDDPLETPVLDAEDDGVSDEEEGALSAYDVSADDEG